MSNKIERLKSFEDSKLIDVVKNYRQYGYDEDIRNAAMEILESRGIEIEHLKLRGEFENKSYDRAEQEHKSFEQSSKIALLFYAIIFIVEIASKLLANYASPLAIVSWISAIGYLVFLIKSFISQSRYYEQIGEKESQFNAGLYFTVGAFFYFVMYFVFRKQIKADINKIR